MAAAPARRLVKEGSDVTGDGAERARKKPEGSGRGWGALSIYKAVHVAALQANLPNRWG